MKVLIKNLISFILPITATIIIPYLIIGNANLPILYDPSLFVKVKFIAGLVVIITGLSVLISTICTFILIGKGTLAPWNPASRLIVGGIYGYARNPMITAVLFILIGEAALFNSGKLILWSTCFFILNHFYFIFYEEPGLLKRFGNEYQVYKRNVPRWIPRLQSWKTYHNSKNLY